MDFKALDNEMEKIATLKEAVEDYLAELDGDEFRESRVVSRARESFSRIKLKEDYQQALADAGVEWTGTRYVRMVKAQFHEYLDRLLGIKPRSPKTLHFDTVLHFVMEAPPGDYRLPDFWRTFEGKLRYGMVQRRLRHTIATKKIPKGFVKSGNVWIIKMPSSISAILDLERLRETHATIRSDLESSYPDFEWNRLWPGPGKTGTPLKSD